MKCGECTLCCTLLAVDDIQKQAGEKCVHCDNGCAIYESRPDSCKSFYCAYAQMEKVNIALRPDKCGVIFEKINDWVVLGSVDPDRGDYPNMIGQVKSFYNLGASVVLVKSGHPKVYPQKDVTYKELIQTVNTKRD